MKLDLEGAMKWAADYHSGSRRKFLEGLKKVPSWGEEIDIQVQQYLNGIACWPRGNYCWSFESGRYFGNKGLDYQKTLQCNARVLERLEWRYREQTARDSKQP